MSRLEFFSRVGKSRSLHPVKVHGTLLHFDTSLIKMTSKIL
jgi:hypothetical protein